MLDPRKKKRGSLVGGSGRGRWSEIRSGRRVAVVHCIASFFERGCSGDDATVVLAEGVSREGVRGWRTSREG